MKFEIKEISISLTIVNIYIGYLLSSTFHPDFIKGLNNFERAFPEFVEDKTVVYAGTCDLEYNGVRITDYRKMI